MNITQTESTDTKVWELLEWNLRTLNTPFLIESQVAVSPELRNMEIEEGVSGGIALAEPPTGSDIDKLIHETLLEESLVQYADIWRTLAEK